MIREKLGSLLLVAATVAGLCAVYFLTGLLDIPTADWGILPRSTAHWQGVLTAPLAHVSASHLFANAVGLLTFGALTALRSKQLFVLGSLAIVLLGGGMVWLLGRAAWHIGASGWVYGLWALNISYACFDRRFGNILLALVVAFVYGGLSYGLLPMERTVSFEMHLAGALAGVVCAYVSATHRRRQRTAKTKEPSSARSIE